MERGDVWFKKIDVLTQIIGTNTYQHITRSNTLITIGIFLSIIRPEGEPTTPLPVLLFVHGGGFQAGSGSQYIAGMRGFLNAGIQAGAPPAMVVVINYRLGAFGFMGGSMMESLANRTQPDAVLNAGTRDIKAATEWVRDNIADFGGECSASALDWGHLLTPRRSGDTSRITLWGQSAGAFSTGAQILGQAATGRNASDTSNSPFSAAILQSGNPGGVRECRSLSHACTCADTRLHSLPAAALQGPAV